MRTRTLACLPAVNGGNFLMLPTPASILLFTKWAALAPQGIAEQKHDQDFLVGLRYNSSWVRCNDRWMCREMMDVVRTAGLAPAPALGLGCACVRQRAPEAGPGPGPRRAPAGAGQLLE